MSKAEKFIQDYTRNCSNEFEPQKAPPSVYNPWLTPDEARKAVEIAREEVMERACDAYCKVCKLNCNHRKCHYLNNFKQAMKDE